MTAPMSTAVRVGRPRLRDRRVVRLVGYLFDRVVRGPVVEGRFADTGWPYGLRGIAVAGLACYAVLIVATGASGWLRARGDLLYTPDSLTLPRAAYPVLVVGIALSLSCLTTAALHFRTPARLGTFVVVASILLRWVDWGAPQWRDVVSLTAAATLLIVLVLRWRRAFHWLEFIVVAVVLSVATLNKTVLTQRNGGGAATDQALNGLYAILPAISDLGVPLSLLAGAALVELTSSTCVWLVSGTYRALHAAGHRRAWIAGIVVVLVAARVTQVTYQLLTDTEGVHRLLPLAVGIGEFLVLQLSGWAIIRRALRRPWVTHRPDPDDVVSAWNTYAIILAVILAISTTAMGLIGIVAKGFAVPGGLVDVLWGFGGRWQVWILQGTAALVQLVIAVRWSGQGRRRGPLLLTISACYGVLVSANSAADLLVSRDGLLLGADLAALGVAAWLTLVRRWTAEAAVSLMTVWLLTLAYEYRDAINEPLTALFALSGVTAVLVVGLIWRALTDQGWTRGDSPGFPRPSRVLLALASSLFAVSIIATVALSGGLSTIDLERVERLGDTQLGLTLLLAVISAGLMVAVSGRLVREVPHGPRI